MDSKEQPGTNSPPISQIQADSIAKLTDRQKRFVFAYAEHGVGARAAREAGYSEKTAKVEACKLLKRPEVKAALSGFMEEHAMSAGECIGRLSLWGRGNLEPFITYIDEVQYNPLTGVPYMDANGQAVTRTVARLDLSTDVAKANIHLLKKAKQGQYGLEIELTDPKDAVDKLLQVYGRYKQKIDISMLSDQQIDELLEKALNKLVL